MCGRQIYIVSLVYLFAASTLGCFQENKDSLPPQATNADLSLSPSSASDFGAVSVSGSADYTFTLSNSGGSTATNITAPSLQSPFSYTGGSYPGGGDCGSNLLKNSSCTVGISYDPTDMVSYSQVITLAYNNGALSTSYVVTLSGSGIPDSSFIYQVSGNVTLVSATGDDHPLAFASDGSGNFYIVGKTSGAFEGSNSGGFDAFVLKVNELKEAKWAKQFGTSSFEEFGAVAVDSQGYVIAAGYSDGSLFETNASAGSSGDAIVAKLNATDGSVSWSIQLGNVTVGSDSGADEYDINVRVDSNDNVFLSGITSGNLGETSNGSKDGFVVKISSLGQVLWIKQLGTTTMGTAANGDDMPYDLAIDSSDNVILVGRTMGALGETSGGDSDVFMAKLAGSNGAVSWLKQLGSPTMGSASSGHDTATRVRLDSSDNIYISGETTGALGEASAGNFDSYVLKANSSGTVQWVRQLGSTSGGSSNVDTGLSLSIDSSGNSLLVGRTSGTMSEGNAGAMDGYFAQISSTGAVTRIKQFGNSTSSVSATQNEVFEDAYIKSDGSLFMVGYSEGNFVETNSGQADIILIKLKSDGSF